MQIKFLTIYHSFDDVDYAKQCAQDSLLYMWMRSLQLKQIKLINKATIEFKDYDMLSYPDQERAKREVDLAYGKRDKRKTGAPVEYWWCGKQYSDLHMLYTALAEQKRFMELTITVDDEVL